MKRNSPKFKIYKYEFTCDVCGDETCMGIVGYPSQNQKICDLCLINASEEEAEERTEKRKEES